MDAYEYEDLQAVQRLHTDPEQLKIICGNCNHVHQRADSDGGPGACREDSCQCQNWVPKK
jgi:hypothetical protein